MLRAVLAALIAACCVSVGWAEEPSRIQVEVSLVPCGELPDEEIRLLAWRDGAGEAVEAPLSRELQKAVLQLPPGVRHVIVPKAASIWGEAVELSDPARRVEVRAWPRAELHGRLAVPRGETRPVELTLRARRVEASETAKSSQCLLDEVTVDCPVDAEGAWSCGLPAGEWNVRLKSDGWAARHLWKLALEGGARRDAGVVELRHGGTVFGEVTTVDGPADRRIARISLQPGDASVADAESRSEADELRLIARLDDQGFFLFEGVPPGLYSLIAHQPGFAPTTLYPVEVADDRETTILAPLLLAPPAVLVVETTPAAPPEGDPWRIAVLREADAGGSLSEVDGGSVDGTSGRWRSMPLPAGRYRVQAGSGSVEVMAAAEVTIEEGDGEEVFVPLDLDVVEVEGSVTLGTEPLSATLWFGGRSGYLRVRAESDEEGRYRTFLPSGGEWLVDVVGDEPAVHRTDVEVDVGEGGDEVDIRLPATRLAGEVRDGEGQPVSGAFVRLSGELGEEHASLVTLQSAADGRFEASGLAEGALWVEAEDGGRRSPRVGVELREGGAEPWLVLELREQRTISGRVVADGAGVRGATVMAVPAALPNGLSLIESVATGATGEVELRMAPGADRLVLFVLPPGYGFTLAEAGGDGFVVPVAPPDGELLLRGALDGESGMIALLRAGGRVVDVGLLVRWASMHGRAPEGADLAVPSMPAGSYEYCLVRPEEALLVWAGRAAPASCTAGLLAVGGVLELDRPATGR